MGRGKIKYAHIGVAAFLAVIFFLALVLTPFSKEIAGDAAYFCNWGSQTTRESYTSALNSLQRAEEEQILLLRDGETGKIPVSEAYKRAYRILSQGSAEEVLSFRLNEVTRLERSALFVQFGEGLYYADGTYLWNGREMQVTDRKQSSVVTLLSGVFPKRFLSESGATSLVLCREADFYASALTQSFIREIHAQSPYFMQDGALYVERHGSSRLVAALPQLQKLTLRYTDFIDAGALSACKGLVELTIPYVGNALWTNFENYVPYFGHLFEKEDGRYRIPSTLKKVTVMGGRISAFAFFGADGLEEIDARRAQYVEREAFSACNSLKTIYLRVKLHIEGFDVIQNGECYLYIKKEGKNEKGV